MLTINNFRLKGIALKDCAKELRYIFQSKLDSIGVYYSISVADNTIIFSEVEKNKLFLSNKENHIPLNETDKRYKKEKPYLITNKLTEGQYLSTEQIILNTLINMGIWCDIKTGDDVLVKDLTVITPFPKPKSYPIGV